VYLFWEGKGGGSRSSISARLGVEVEDEGSDWIAFLMNQLFLLAGVGILAIGVIFSGCGFFNEVAGDSGVGTRLLVRERYHPDRDIPRSLVGHPLVEFLDRDV
jgi:hypothetical protein